MKVYTPKMLTILRHSTIITLFCLSSSLVHAMEEDYSKVPSVKPKSLPQFEKPLLESIDVLPSSIPSAQPKDIEVELKRELELARLRRQVAEEKRRALAEEELLAAELLDRNPGAQQSSLPPVDPFVSLLTAFGGGRSQQHVEHNVHTELSRFGESFGNFLTKGKFKHNKRLEKDERKRQQRAASSSSPSRVVSSPSLEPSSSHPKRVSSLSSIEEEVLPHQKDVPLPFNPSFKTTSPGAVPQGYLFVEDPAQKGRTWGPSGIIQEEEGQVKLTGDGYVFYYKLTKDDIIKFAGQELIFSADVKSNTPGAYLQYWDFPNPDKTQSAPYGGGGDWETLKFKFKVDPSKQQYFLYPAILPSVKGSTPPVVEIKNVRLRHNNVISKED
jgi:hypothetical protein